MFLSLLAVLFLLNAPNLSEREQVDKAITLYEAGLYPQAMDILQLSPLYGSDALVDGYSVLCAYRMRSRGYENMSSSYLQRYGSSHLCDRIRLERAFDYFDRKDYSKALEEFSVINLEGVSESDYPEYWFELGYSLYRTGAVDSALTVFRTVDSLPQNDYSAPARYMTGYVRYTRGSFEEAIPPLEKSLSDSRFFSISNYYIINCRYQLRDYKYVVDKGVPFFEAESMSEDRKAHLARIISESYLFLNDKEKARKFWALSDDGSEKFRADYFYAGNLMYTTGSWQGAIDNYTKMVESKDSLSQIAWYQMAFSYLQLKNRVGALDAFKNASQLSFDRKMTEDAFFNYAKLSFDLNGDTSVFGRYMETYGTKVRGEKIYSYMALASLQDRDYQAAIDFYDKLDILQGKEKNNYVHANYLRGAQLMSGGSYRNAAQCFKAVTYYTDKNDVVNQLARYCLAETCYSDGDYAQAQSVFSELYNASALDGTKQGALLPYNAAWAALGQQKYDQANKWFGLYISSVPKGEYIQDAKVRRADCVFASGDYAAAATAYSEIMDADKSGKDIYPRYQCAVATGLATNPADKTSKAKKNRKQKNLSAKIKLLEPVKKVPASTPYYAEAMFELGKSQLQDRKQTPAVVTFLELAKNAPGSPYAAKALLEVGTVRRGNGNIKGAVECYKRVVETMDSLGCTEDALLALESIYQSQGEPEAYFEYLEKIGRSNIRSDEERQEMLFQAAQQLFSSGNCKKALASFTSFQQKYPDSPRGTECDFFIGECLRNNSDKVRACDAYKKVMEAGPKAKYYPDALLYYAQLSSELENWTEAYDAYKTLSASTNIKSVKSLSEEGMMRAAYMKKDFEAGIAAALVVRADNTRTADVRREAAFILSRCYMALSRRDEALAVMEQLACDPSSSEGAQAAYEIILDCYERADYQTVQTKVYALSGSGTKQQYYVAKSFLVLADSFLAQGNVKQAKATLQSIADGYKTDDDVRAGALQRLEKIGKEQ